MKYISIITVSLFSTLTHAITTNPPNYVPEPETWALLGIAGLAAVVAKHFRKK